MANQAPRQVLLAAFDGIDGADEALKGLQELQKEKTISIKDAAILKKDDESKLHVRDVKDMTGTRGAALGGVTGAIVGAIAGPVGWAAIGGAALGGLVAKLRDSSFEQSTLEQWAERLKPGSSAIVAVIEHVWVLEVERELQQTAREIVTLAIGDEIAAELESSQQ